MSFRTLRGRRPSLGRPLSLALLLAGVALARYWLMVNLGYAHQERSELPSGHLRFISRVPRQGLLIGPTIGRGIHTQSVRSVDHELLFVGSQVARAAGLQAWSVNNTVARLSNAGAKTGLRVGDIAIIDSSVYKDLKDDQGRRYKRATWLLTEATEWRPTVETME